MLRRYSGCWEVNAIKANKKKNASDLVFGNKLCGHYWLLYCKISKGASCLSVTVHWRCSSHSCPALRGHVRPCWHSCQLLLMLEKISALWPPYIWKLSWDHLLILHRSLKWLLGGKVFGLLSTCRTSEVILLWEIPYYFACLLHVVNESQALKVDSQAKLYLLTIYKTGFFAYTIVCPYFFSTFPSRKIDIFYKIIPVFLHFTIVFRFMLLQMLTLLQKKKLGLLYCIINTM